LILSYNNTALILLAELILVITSIATERDTYLDRLLDTSDENLETFYLNTIEKYLDYSNNEVDTVQEINDQNIPKSNLARKSTLRKSICRGSFFGSGAGAKPYNNFGSKSSFLIDQIKTNKDNTDSSAMVLDIIELENKNKTLSQKIEEISNEKEELTREMEILKLQISDHNTTKDQLLKQSIEVNVYRLQLTEKDELLDKLKIEHNAKIKELLQNNDELNVRENIYSR
jgi:hypothetical protein